MIKFGELLDVDANNTTHNKKIRRNKHTIPWVDKYRPSKLSEVVYQHDIIKMLSNILTTGNMPHLLFYGPPGTGKTSSILAIAMELFGPRKYSERVIELNASDERGINIVRNKIVTLAKSAVSLRDPDYLCPAYKIIILDEADAMTTEAQSALRKTMEDNSSKTRFCFICNYINQIIDPIISRCVIFRFKPIDEKNMSFKLLNIAEKEKMKISDDAIKSISNISNGDMRKSIMFLQNLNYLNKYIDVPDVLEIANMVPTDKIDEILTKCINTTVDVNEIVILANEFNTTGYPISIVLSQLIEAIVNNTEINDKMKSQICLHISNTEKRLIDGADEYLQLLSIFMCIKSSFNKKESIYSV
jgi:replication factor C subunit 2/4